MTPLNPIVPANAGIQMKPIKLSGCTWAPAFAGVIGGWA